MPLEEKKKSPCLCGSCLLFRAAPAGPRAALAAWLSLEPCRMEKCPFCTEMQLLRAGGVGRAGTEEERKRDLGKCGSSSRGFYVYFM